MAKAPLPKFRPLERIRQVRDLVGKWPATQAEIREAAYASALVPTPARGGKPSQRIAQRARAAEARAVAAWRNAQKGGSR